MTRIAQIALILNALMAGSAGVGFIAGLVPGSSANPYLARNVGVRELSGAFVMAFVSRRLQKDPSLILLPLVFVFFNLTSSCWEVLVRGNKGAVPPMIIESIYVSIYVVFSALVLRRRTQAAA